MSQQLHGNFTANGSSSSIKWSGKHRVHFSASGTFGGGTVKLEFSLDGGTTWQAAGGGFSMTAAGRAVDAFPRCDLRITLTGATTPNLDAYITPIESD